MRSMLIRLLMVLGMLSGVGQAWAINLAMKGDLEQDAEYHVYDGTLKLNADIDHKPLETRHSAFWLIFQPGGEPQSALPDFASTDYKLRYEPIPSDIPHATELECIRKNPFIWTVVDSIEDSSVPFKQCIVAVTWLEWGWQSYWLNNPFYNLKVGPAGAAMEVSADLREKYPSAPHYQLWRAGEKYVIRIAAKSTTGTDQYQQRIIKYIGKPKLRNNTLDTQTTTVDSNNGKVKISVVPSNRLDYELNSCTTTQGEVAIAGGEVSDDKQEYYITVKLDPSKYKVGESYEFVTECDFKFKRTAQYGSDLVRIYGKDGTKNNSISMITIGKTEVKTEYVSIAKPALTEMWAQFLINHGIRVGGELILDHSDKAVKLEYRFDDQATWYEVPTASAKWDNGCSFCFSFDIPSSNIPGAGFKSLHVRPTDTQHNDAPIVGIPALVAFDLNSFIKIYPINAGGYPVIGEGESAGYRLGKNDLLLKLVVDHPIDHVKVTLNSSVNLTGMPTVRFSSYNKGPDGAPSNNDFSIKTQSGNWPVVFDSDTKTLQLGDYYLVIPINKTDSEPEDNVLGWTVEIPKSELLRHDTNPLNSDSLRIEGRVVL